MTMPHTAANKSCILVVDDTPANLTLLAKILTEAGYSVRVAPNGTLALQSAFSQPPDLILLDIRMPEPDGYNVCRSLKTHPLTADIAVIFLSALSSSEDKLRGFDSGAVDYITKPFDSHEVLARVSTHLKLRSLQAELIEKNTALQKANTELERLATTDSLTGLHNRRAIQQKAEVCMTCAKRYGTPYSVIMFDIDHFKSINDTKGHDAGDRVLQTVAQCVQTVLRDSDILARWGGEEYLVLAPQSDAAESARVAERLRQIISSTQVDDIGQITASFGVADFHDGDTFEKVILMADKAMYQAKQAGRNRVAVYSAQ
jgi:diguanylate cyclase (GGDEF)-like protein